ncbi:MAG: NAD-dependent 4,6-dehydratase LegB [Deltaproteobacteria bacterium]|nr:NAD-dependent 4,6-dehydratase LegB [Deltaproteobacteria bacterium]
MKLKGRRILVTGACGFIGSHLVERLVEEGAKVRAFVYYNSFNHWGWLDSLPKEKLKGIEVFSGDVRDFACVKKAMAGMEAAFHLAALIGIPYSYIAPESYVDTNVKGTLHVLQAAREAGVAKVVHTSTSEVYGTAQYVPIDEDHPLQGQSPYAATKIAADMLAFSFYRSFDVPVAICRPFNTYGPRQSARAIIPTILAQSLNKKGKISLGNTRTTRDFNFVADTVEGFIKIAESEKSLGEVINIGSGQEISIASLVKKISGIGGWDIRVEKDRRRVRPAKSEVFRLCADNTKAKKILRWKPVVSLEKGLMETVEWLKKNQGQYKGFLYNV